MPNGRRCAQASGDPAESTFGFRLRIPPCGGSPSLILTSRSMLRNSSCRRSRRASSFSSERCQAQGRWSRSCADGANRRMERRTVGPTPGVASHCLSGIWATSRTVGQRAPKASRRARLARIGTASTGRDWSDCIGPPGRSGSRAEANREPRPFEGKIETVSPLSVTDPPLRRLERQLRSGVVNPPWIQGDGAPGAKADCFAQGRTMPHRFKVDDRVHFNPKTAPQNAAESFLHLVT